MRGPATSVRTLSRIVLCMLLENQCISADYFNYKSCNYVVVVGRYSGWPRLCINHEIVRLVMKIAFTPSRSFCPIRHCTPTIFRWRTYIYGRGDTATVAKLGCPSSHLLCCACSFNRTRRVRGQDLWAHAYGQHWPKWRNQPRRNSKRLDSKPQQPWSRYWFVPTTDVLWTNHNRLHLHSALFVQNSQHLDRNNAIKTDGIVPETLEMLYAPRNTQYGCNPSILATGFSSRIRGARYYVRTHKFEF